MSLVTPVYRQFRRPTGLLGRLAGWIMANRPSNIERNRWTVDVLNVQPADHVLEIGFGPGLAIAQVARLAPQGRLVGIDHSALMIERASRRTPVLRTIRSVLKPAGVLATTVQPRQLGATAADAQEFARTLSREMIEAGFRDVTIKQLDLEPVPAVCVIGVA